VEPFLTASGVTKAYGAVQALKGVSFEIGAGEVLGICGHNGAGKTTLMKILSGLESPDEGTLRVRGEPVELPQPQDAQRLGIALLDQELSIVPVLTVAENLTLGNVGERGLVRKRVLRDRATELLARVGLSHVPADALAEDLQLGERQLVEIARLLGRNASLLILDEPTAALSRGEITRVFDAVRRVAADGRSVIFVSHRLDEVLAVCDRVMVMRDGRAVATEPAAALEKSRLVGLMLGEAGQELPAPARETRHEGAVTVSQLSVPGRIENLDFEFDSGTIIGIAGQVGSGATVILRALAGLTPEATGRVSIAGRDVRFATPRQAKAAGIQYISNDRKGEGLFLSQTIEANLNATRLNRLSRKGWLAPRATLNSASELAKLVGIPAERLRSPVSTLSGGNQQKVLLGRCLRNESLSLLLLDDPTRGVDVGGRAEIHRLIRLAAAGGTTVVFSSTELDEVMELSDVVVTMFAGRVVSICERHETHTERVLREMTHEPAGR
jgi:ABC-type sugar transport system ATPase subunit